MTKLILRRQGDVGERREQLLPIHLSFDFGEKDHELAVRETRSPPSADLPRALRPKSYDHSHFKVQTFEAKNSGFFGLPPLPKDLITVRPSIDQLPPPPTLGTSRDGMIGHFVEKMEAHLIRILSAYSSHDLDRLLKSTGSFEECGYVSTLWTKAQDVASGSFTSS